MRSSSLIWNSCFLFEDGIESVLFDPVTLESVILDASETLVIKESSAPEVVPFLANLGFPGNSKSLAYGFNDFPERLNSRIDELKLKRVASRIGGYRLVITDKCNMACTYCFVRTNTGENDITLEKLDAALAFLFEQNRDREEVLLQWFGGEPTIRFDLIQAGDKIAQRLAHKFNVKRVRRTIVTNGLSITDEMIRHFDRYRYGVGVSIDGPPEINRQSRMTLGKQDVTHRIQESIRRISKSRNISVGINVTPNASNQFLLRDIVKYALEVLSVKFVYANFPIPANGFWDVDGKKLAEEFYQARLFALSRGGMFFSAIDRVYQALDSRIPRVIDHMGFDGSISAAVLPDGRISLCDLNWQTDEFLFEVSELKHDPDKLNLLAKPLFPSADCRSCSAIAICGGPTRNDAVLTNSTEPDPQFCSFYRRAVELVAWDGSCLQ
jgi:uncharacterized protein